MYQLSHARFSRWSLRPTLLKDDRSQLVAAAEFAAARLKRTRVAAPHQARNLAPQCHQLGLRLGQLRLVLAAVRRRQLLHDVDARRAPAEVEQPQPARAQLEALPVGRGAEAAAREQQRVAAQLEEALPPDLRVRRRRVRARGLARLVVDDGDAAARQAVQAVHLSNQLEGRQAGGWLRRQLRPHPRLVRERLAMRHRRRVLRRQPVVEQAEALEAPLPLLRMGAQDVLLLVLNQE
mmetsp:Transcript_6983/g.20995  ORF Transcript_6983/g.20995 Transcript_6983/m.20995 type:complete len:236 (+) Transcript_6983:437-1144(+)